MVLWRSGYANDCKSFSHRFKSGRHLQFFFPALHFSPCPPLILSIKSRSPFRIEPPIFSNGASLSTAHQLLSGGLGLRPTSLTQCSPMASSMTLAVGARIAIKEPFGAVEIAVGPLFWMEKEELSRQT